jgi:glycosyltransferase involved in cell wall biosynthesis
MQILYIHQYFATPKGSTGTRSYEFARRWVTKGYKVTMLTTTAALTIEDLAGVRGLFFKRLTIDGIDVFALSIPYRQQMEIMARCLSFIGFIVVSSFLVLFTKRPDIIYATSTPLTVGIPALVGKWIRRIPFVFEVRDQWPAVPIELGIIKNKLLVRVLLWLEKTIYQNSFAIVTLSPGMEEGIKSVIGNKKHISIIPNSCDTEVFRPDISGDSIRKRYNWNDKLVLLHAGAMGKANGLDFVIDAAVRLKDNPEILFVLLGDGNQKPALQKRARRLELTNIQILPSVPRDQLPAFFAGADIGLVIIGNFPVVQHNSANKFFDSLSAGKPVLLNYSGWKKEVLEKNNAGFGCKQCNIGEFAEKVLYFNSNRDKLVEMGKNARKLATERFDRDRLAKKALDVITSL